MLYAVIRPYGGFNSGRPWGPIPHGPRLTPGPSCGTPPPRLPPPPPPPPAGAAGAGPPPRPPAGAAGAGAPRPAAGAPPPPPGAASGSPPPPPPPMYSISERSPASVSDCPNIVEIDGMYSMLVSGSQDPPCHKADPCAPGALRTPRMPLA